MRRPLGITFRVIPGVVLAAGIAVGLSTLSRPPIVPADGPSGAFSAERAMVWVEAVSLRPHAPGSDEIDKVRGTIVSGLESLGYEPEIRETTAVVDHGSSMIASWVENVVVTIPGTDSTGAILLDAHYDTRAMTPGAADNGTAVATLMEIARILAEEPTLRNDVVLLFTDNEEYGAGLGALGFIEGYEKIEDIQLVVNFEGLGHSGPSILFETGPDSGDAVRRWARATRRPVGQSWFPEIYTRTPIGTDLNRFSDAGVPGLNFGFWSGSTAYHTALDTPENLDPRSLQHHGEHALALVRDYGNKDFEPPRPAPSGMVYFNPLPGTLVRYSTTWSIPLAVVAGLAVIAIVILGVRRKRWTAGGILAGLGGFAAVVIASSGLSTVLWMAATRLHGEYRAMMTFRGMVYNAHWYYFAFAGLTVALAAIARWLFQRRAKTPGLEIGALVFLCLLGLGTAILAPGFSYLFTWPVIFAAVAWTVVLLNGWMDDGGSAKKAMVLTLGAFPGVVLFSAALPVMYHFALAPMIGILAFMTALLFAPAVPALDLFTRRRPWIVPGVFGAVCLALLVVGSLTAGFSIRKPRPNAIAYFVDADSGEAAWIGAGTERDWWTDQFLSAEAARSTAGEAYPLPRRSRFPVWRDDAPVVRLPPPVIEIVGDSASGDSRILDLRLTSPRGAEVITLDIGPYDAIRSATVAGKTARPPASTRDYWGLSYYAVPDEGLWITLEIDPSRPVEVQLADQTWELTDQVKEILEPAYRKRGEDMVRMPNFDYGTVVVTRSVWD